MEVSKFLKKEKSLCRELEKKILSEESRILHAASQLTSLTEEVPHAIPQGKKYHIEIVDIKVRESHPSMLAKVIWLGKLSGEDMRGEIKGQAGHSVQSSLTNLRLKVDEMARAERK